MANFWGLLDCLACLDSRACLVYSDSRVYWDLRESVLVRRQIDQVDSLALDRVVVRDAEK